MAKEYMKGIADQLAAEHYAAGGKFICNFNKPCAIGGVVRTRCYGEQVTVPFIVKRQATLEQYLESLPVSNASVRWPYGYFYELEPAD